MLYAIRRLMPWLSRLRCRTNTNCSTAAAASASAVRGPAPPALELAAPCFGARPNRRLAAKNSRSGNNRGSGVAQIVGRLLQCYAERMCWLRCRKPYQVPATAGTHFALREHPGSPDEAPLARPEARDLRVRP